MGGHAGDVCFLYSSAQPMVLLGFIYKTQAQRSNDQEFKDGSNKELGQVLGHSEHGALYDNTGYVVIK